MVSDQEIAQAVETLLCQLAPNDVTSSHGVVQQLEAQLGLDLSHKSAFICDHISFLLRPYAAQPHPQKDIFSLNFHHHYQQPPLQLLPQQFIPQQFPPYFAPNPHHRAPAPHGFPVQQLLTQQLRFQALPQPSPVKLQKTTAPAPETPTESAPASGTKRRGGSGGLSKVCGVSPELQAVVGEPALPRTEIVKQLWAYIRKNHLQDPSNKRKIICDDALRMVFETDCTDMFKMNKLLSKHIIPLGPNKETNQSKRVKLDVKSPTDSTEPQPQTQPSSPTARISEPLAKFLGSAEKEMQLSEAKRLVWEYVKLNCLKDPSSSTLILCDEKLHELLGCESISAERLQETLDRYHLLKQ